MKCNYNSNSGRVPSSLEAIGMFKAILMAQNNGNSHKVDSMFTKRGGGYLFRGNFQIDGEDKYIELCFLPKIKMATHKYSNDMTLEKDDDDFGYCLQAVSDCVMNVIRDFVIKDYYVFVGTAKFTRRKNSDGTIKLHVEFPIIADKKENYTNG